MSDLVIDVARRAPGKNESRRLRVKGLIPGILYGEGKDPVPVAVEARAVDRVLRSARGENALFQLALEGTEQKRLVMIKDYQLDPVGDHLLHADFIRIQADREVRVRVHVELEGLPLGVKNEGGLLEFTTREIEVACLPTAIPDALKVDVSGLHLNQVLRVGEVPLPPGLRATSDRGLVVCSVHMPKAEVVETPAAVPVEGAVPAEGAAAAAPAEGASATTAPAAAGGAAPAAAKPEAKDAKAKDAKDAKAKAKDAKKK